MTGKYPHSHGLCANHYPIPPDQIFLPQVLRDNGYQTGYFGKWHLNGGRKHDFVPPDQRLGFETFVGFSRGHRYFESIYYRDDDPRPYVSTRYEPDYQTDQLIGFMEDSLPDPQNRPFFGMICYGPPHPPLTAPEEYLSLYSPDDISIRGNVPDDAAVQRKAREFLSKYYGLVRSVDDNIGRVLEWLDARGIADNTIVILVSDHGEMAWEHGLLDKKNYFEAAMRVPFIVRFPQMFGGNRTVNGLVDPSIDIMPTLLEICGMPIPRKVQGTSCLPLLDGTAASIRDAVFYEICMEREGPEAFPIPERGIRTQDWLYVRTRHAPKALFDLKNDPLEMTNLVESPLHRAVAEELDRRLRAHMDATEDDWDIEAVFPPPDFQTHREGASYADAIAKRAVRVD